MPAFVCSISIELGVEPEYYCYDYTRELWVIFIAKNPKTNGKPHRGISHCVRRGLDSVYTHILHGARGGLWRRGEKKKQTAAGDMVVAGLTGERCHVLNNTWLAAFNFGNAVIILLGAGVDIHGFIDSGRQVCLGSLPGQVGARNFHLQAGLVGRSGYDVKILRVHVYYFTYVLLRY
jgi:hypothetical protein